MRKSKKLFSILLTAVLVITLMSVMTVTSQAKSDHDVTSAAQVKAYLQASEYNCVVLQKDIKLVDDFDSEFWCTINGSKWINLNGHSLSVSNDNGRKYSTMFNVPSGARLIVYDSTKSGKGNIHFDGRINDSGSFRDRSIFEVSGELELNGVTVEAGRSKSFYSAKYAKTVWKQIFGAAVTAKDGSKVYINASTLYGRGNNSLSVQEPSHDRNAGIIAYSGSAVYFNDGEIKAKGGANCFNIYSGATVSVLSGTFTCDKLDAIKCDGSITSGIGKGRVGLTATRVGNYAAVASRSPSDGNLKDVTKLTVAPAGNGDGKFTAQSGDQVQENGIPVNRLLSSNPKVELDIFLQNWDGYYFKNLNLSTLGVDYVRNYTMKLYHNGVLIQSKGPYSTAARTFDVNEIFSGFTPSKNSTYKLVCEFDQVLNNKVHATGKTTDFFFRIVDDVAAPTITSQSPTDVYYDTGNNVNMTVNATGSNLTYEWQCKKPDVYYFSALSDNTSTIKVGPMTEADDGTVYRCSVSNSQGTVWSQNITLHYKGKQISQIDLKIDAPVHGIPLDFTAETTTAGCKVVDVQWEVLMGDKVSQGYAPYAGQTMVVDIIVQEDGATFADNAVAYIGSKKYSTKSFPASDQLRFSFSFDAAAPASGDVVIDTAWMQLTEPAVGSKPGYLSIIQNGPYDGTFARDVRFGDGSTEWTCDGKTVSMSEPLQAGKTYTVKTTLTPSKGWKFTESSKAEVNGEPMDVSLQGGKLIVSKTYVMDESADPSSRPNPFVDVYESDYYYDAVIWAYYSEPQITNGMDDTHFGPKSTVTRGQCVAFLWRSAGCPEPKSSYNPFVDVPTWQYYYKPVLWAVENGITKGTSDTTFEPDSTLSTQHIVTFLYRTKNPGMDGWDGGAAEWACQPYGGKPFGVDIEINNWTPCPRCNVVVFLYRSAAKA